jgi:hypothetical protein
MCREAAQQSLSRENLMIDGEIWDVHVGERKLVKNIQEAILEYNHKEDIRQYYKERINYNYFEQVNWQAIKKAMKSSTPALRNWVVKRAAKDCGANEVLHKSTKIQINAASVAK